MGSEPTRTACDVETALIHRVGHGELKIPAYPAIALRLAALVRTTDFGLADVVAAISADQALAAAVIRCANSAMYARGNDVTSLQQAVSLIGAKDVVNVALASTLGAGAHAAGSLQALKRQAWQSALTSALICHELAKLRALPPGDAFLCGLLHDFGWIVGVTCLEDVFADHPELPAQPAELLSALAQRVHVELGLVVAARWKMPDLFSDAISLHHEERPAASAFASEVEVVAVSDQIVALLAAGASVSPEALVKAARVTPSEAAALALMLPQIPEIIASLEGEAAPRAQPTKLIERAASDGLRRVDLDLRIVQPPKRLVCKLVAVGANVFRLEASGSLLMNQLIETEVLTEPKPLRLWAKVTSCVQRGQEYDIECQPFALSGQMQKTWSLLVRAAA